MSDVFSRGGTNDYLQQTILKRGSFGNAIIIIIIIIIITIINVVMPSVR